MLRSVALVRTDVSQEISACIIRVTKIGELGSMLAQLATDARCEEIPMKMRSLSLSSPEDGNRSKGLRLALSKGPNRVGVCVCVSLSLSLSPCLRAETDPSD
jgi:hypothetical protein